MFRRSAFYPALLFPILTWWITPPDPIRLQIAVSGNIKDSMMEISRYYETRNPGSKVDLFFGDGAEVASQVENHATFDVFIGDEEDMKLLKEKGVVVEKSKIPLFSNQVVAVVPEGSEWEVTDSKQVTADNVKRIALQKENSKNGRLAREYLKKLGVLDALKDKIHEVKNPKGAIEAIKSDEAKWTIVYATEAERRKGIKILWRIPTTDYPALQYSAVELTSTLNKDHAKRILTALQSSISRKIFENSGFQLQAAPPPPPR